MKKKMLTTTDNIIEDGDKGGKNEQEQISARME